jgi:hypothetical protein
MFPEVSQEGSDLIQGKECKDQVSTIGHGGVVDVIGSRKIGDRYNITSCKMQ